MKTAFYSLMLLLLLAACDKDEELTENYIDSKMTWTVGAQFSVDTVLTLPGSKAEDNYLEVESSVCPNQDVKIQVTAGSEVLLDTVYHDGDKKYKINNPTGKELKVHTWLVDNGSLILCIWLGQAKFTYEYND